MSVKAFVPPREALVWLDRMADPVYGRVHDGLDEQPAHHNRRGGSGRMTKTELRAVMAAIIFAGGLSTDAFSPADAVRAADKLLRFAKDEPRVSE